MFCCLCHVQEISTELQLLQVQLQDLCYKSHQHSTGIAAESFADETWSSQCISSVDLINLADEQTPQNMLPNVAAKYTPISTH